ncbi:hypothetical protein OHC33_003044 [Knufia fluminis]|uniref:Acyltransferase 3 domain-containing protein n=2 Tax=Knufia TaxID=430999 RepID=A0AAN8FBW7_9EURO|nr:hypothetical protein OHC33_003044 [Knufia fluminis]
MPGSQHHALQAAASSSTIQSSEASSGFLEFDQDERFSTTSRPWKWLQDASRVAQKLSPANLRDVSTGASVEQDTLPVHMVASSSISASRETTAFLDGMRGIAAFCVVVEHFAIPFQPTMFHGFQGVEHSHFLQLPIIRLCYNGSSMVCIFFVISGFALSVKPVRMIGEKDWDSFYREMESAIFRRGIRLFIPVVVVSFTMMLAAHTGLADVQSDVKYEGSPAIHSAFWLRQPVSIPGFWHQLKDWLRFILSMVLIPGTWRGTGRGYEYVELKQSQYGTQFWTIPVEYWSSILLFAALIGTARAHTISRWATLIALTCLSMAIG